MTKKDLSSLKIKRPDLDIMKRVQDRWDNLSKPLDGLGDFEKVTCKIHSVLGQEYIDKYKKCLVIFCADNGVVENGVSQCGQENTSLVATLLGENKSSANTFAKFCDADVYTVDIGINSSNEIPGIRNEKIMMGTNDFLKLPAMSENDTLKAIEVGIKMAKECREMGYHLIATGEMGIGNTTTATALLCAITGKKVSDVTGRGAGLSDEGLVKKIKVIEMGIQKYALTAKSDPVFALSCVGGLDIAALTGLYIGAAIEGVPVIIDGLISAVAALYASKILPGCEAFMIGSHSGKEKGVKTILKELSLCSFIDGNMAFGEGMGALMLFPLLDMALDFLNNAGSFQDGNIEKYERLN